MLQYYKPLFSCFPFDKTQVQISSHLNPVLSWQSFSHYFRLQYSVLCLASRCPHFQIYPALLVSLIHHHQFEVFSLMVIVVFLTGSSWIARISRNTRTSSNNLLEIIAILSKCSLWKHNLTADAISRSLVSPRVCLARMDLQDPEGCQGATEQRSAGGATNWPTLVVFFFKCFQWELTVVLCHSCKLPLPLGTKKKFVRF